MDKLLGFRYVVSGGRYSGWSSRGQWCCTMTACVRAGIDERERCDMYILSARCFWVLRRARLQTSSPSLPAVLDSSSSTATVDLAFLLVSSVAGALVFRFFDFLFPSFSLRFMLPVIGLTEVIFATPSLDLRSAAAWRTRSVHSTVSVRNRL